jgi:hypothetical protein
VLTQVARCYVVGAITLIAIWAFLNAATPGGSNSLPRRPFYAALDAIAPFDLIYAALARAATNRPKPSPRP